MLTVNISGCLGYPAGKTTPEVALNRSTDLGRSRESIIGQLGHPDIAINDDGSTYYYYENAPYEWWVMILPVPSLLPPQKLTDEPYCSILAFDNSDSLTSIDFRKGSCAQAVYIRQNSNLLQERAETGDAEAQWRLYKRTDDVVDISNMIWLCRAADGGQPWARMEIGRLYQEGIVLKKNQFRAYLWYALAGQAGLVNALDEIIDLRKQMSLEQIKEADQLITDWQPGQCEQDLIAEIQLLGN